MGIGDIIMRTSSLFIVALSSAAFSAPVYAGVAVPGPEAGMGLGAMAIVGAGYLYLKKRLNRD